MAWPLDTNRTSGTSYKALTQQLDVVINQNSSLFQAGRRTHRHAAAVLDAISLSRWTATNQSHAAASVTPLGYGSWFWHDKLPGLCNQPKQDCAGKG